MGTVANLKDTYAAEFALFIDTDVRNRLLADIMEKSEFHRTNAGSSATDKALAKLVTGQGPRVVLEQFAAACAVDPTTKGLAITGVAPALTMNSDLITSAALDTMTSAHWTPIAQALGF